MWNVRPKRVELRRTYANPFEELSRDCEQTTRLRSGDALCSRHFAASRPVEVAPKEREVLFWEVAHPAGLPNDAWVTAQLHPRSHRLCRRALASAPEAPLRVFPEPCLQLRQRHRPIVHIAAHRGRNAAFRVFPAVLR